MEIGIVGLPNTGKTTLFNVLTAQNAEVNKFPFTTIQPNIGVAIIPDKRLEEISSIFKPPKTTYPTIKFVDIAGLIKGAHQGLGLGNQFLSYIRTVDAVVQVIRGFTSQDIPNPIEKIDPNEEIEIIKTELLLADLDQAIRIREKLKGRSDEERMRINLLEEVIKKLNENIPLRECEFVNELPKEYNFLSAKPIMYLLNTDGKNQINFQGDNKITIDVKFELELLNFSKEEKEKIRSEFGYKTSPEDVINLAFKLLNQITFLYNSWRRSPWLEY